MSDDRALAEARPPPLLPTEKAPVGVPAASGDGGVSGDGNQRANTIGQYRGPPTETAGDPAKKADALVRKDLLGLVAPVAGKAAEQAAKTFSWGEWLSGLGGAARTVGTGVGLGVVGGGVAAGTGIAVGGGLNAQQRFLDYGHDYRNFGVPPLSKAQQPKQNSNRTLLYQNYPVSGATTHVQIRGKRRRANQCQLVRYKSALCPDDQKHHSVADRAFRAGARGSDPFDVGGVNGLTEGDGLVLCLSGLAAQPGTAHNVAQTQYDLGVDRVSHNGLISLGQAEDIGAKSTAAGAARDGRDCDPDYLKHQLRAYHKLNGLDSGILVRAQNDPLDAGQAKLLGTH